MQDSFPPTVLLGVKSHLSLVDKRLARCVSREWAAELATAVRTVQLPPELWQVPGPHQAAALARLATTFWSFQSARLLADSQRDADVAAVDAAVAMLRGIGALQAVSVCRLGGSSTGWAALLGGLAGLGSRVTSLELQDVRLPGPAGLDALGGLANIRSLALHSNSSTRLQQQHVEALSRMAGLTSLKLSFRATAGTLAVPVTLDALGRMGSLAQLEVRYLGMPELATGVCFADDFILPGCTSLQRLVLSRVPTPSLRGLFRLPLLHHLSLAQLAPLAESQARSLSLCTQLQQLNIDNMPLELLPQLAALVRLTTLSVRLWVPPAAGGQEMPGGLNVLALAALINLDSLQLTGPVMVSQEEVVALAAGLARLRSLSLAVTLLDGCAGFGGFQALRQLKVAAWTSDCSRRAGQAGLGGFDEAPLDGRQGVPVALGDLPLGLRVLEGRELHFTAPAALQQQQEAGDSAVPALRALKLHHSPDSELAGRPLVLPAPKALAALAMLDVQHPQLTAGQLDDAVSACGRSLTSLSINVASVGSQLCKPLRPAARQSAAPAPVPGVSRSASEGGAAGKAGAGASSSSGGAGSSSGGYFAAAAAAVAAAAAAGATFGSSVAAATAAATAGAATAGALSRSHSLSRSGSFSSSRQGVLEGLGLPSMSLQSMGSASLAAMLDATLGGGGGGSGALSAMGGGLSEGAGLACLARCSQLAELSLVLGDRALGPKARAAIAALPGLRQLRLAVAADLPAAAARELGPWLAGLRRLEVLSLALEGPEAGDALEALAAGVAAALPPACQVVVLKPAMMG